MPRFPNFKRLELADQQAISDFTSGYPLYSDFDFASLWCWDVVGQTSWCMHNGNLVISMRDYSSSNPILTILGTADVDSAVGDLLAWAAARGLPACLFLVPEVTAHLLDDEQYQVAPSRDHFDYLYDVANHVRYEGTRLKSHRANVKAFERRYGPCRVQTLEGDLGSITDQLLELWAKWERHAARPISDEETAFRRFLVSAGSLNHLTTCVYLGRSLAAFDVTVFDGSLRGNSLFAKADVRLRGIYSVLQREVSRCLLERGCECINFEQDLGLPGLRQAKLSFQPTSFLRKYIVAPRNDLHVGRIPTAETLLATEGPAQPDATENLSTFRTARRR
jgi:hypothetical protein